MSYILDALRKAAEQRGPSATVLLRPSAPLMRGGGLRRLPWIVVGVLLLLNIAGVVYLMWPAPPIQPAPAPVAQPKVTLIQPIEAPPAPPPTQVIPAEPPRAPVKAAPGPIVPAVKPGAASSTPGAIASAPPAPAKVMAEKPGVEKPAVIEKSVGDKAIVRITPGPATRPVPAEPKATAAAPAKADGQRFKLEVLSYSDVPAQRLVFINGRRYREGEIIEGGVKVEQIREDSVLLNEEGQRFTLR